MPKSTTIRIRSKSPRKGPRRGKKILFVSSPVGLGHASRDVTIADILKKQFEVVSIQFASSRAAARYIADKGWPVMDTRLPPIQSYCSRIQGLSEVIQAVAPDIVLTDEELVAIPLAKSRRLPVLAITDYLPQAPGEELSFYQAADRLIIPDVPENHPHLGGSADKILFVGPMFSASGERNLEVAQLRSHLNINDGTKVLLVTAGGRVDESKTLYEAAIQAYEGLSWPNKKLIVIAGPLREELLARHPGREDMAFIGYTLKMADHFLLSDVVITRGGHSTLWELALQGVPSISVPFPPRLNALNEIFCENMGRLGTTVVVKNADLTPQALADLMNDAGRLKRMKDSALVLREAVDIRKPAWKVALISVIKPLIQKRRNITP